MKIQDYVPNPNKKTYYVPPANSLCFMDGGIDYSSSRIIFPNIEIVDGDRFGSVGLGLAIDAGRKFS